MTKSFDERNAEKSRRVCEAMDRELDGIYFRVERDGKWGSACFSDLTEEQMRDVLSGRSKEWLLEMCVILGKRIREIGDQLDIVCGDAE